MYGEPRQHSPHNGHRRALIQGLVIVLFGLMVWSMGTPTKGDSPTETAIVSGTEAATAAATNSTNTTNSTATAQAITRATLSKMLTPIPPRYEVRVGKSATIEGINLKRLGLGPIAIDGNGLIYVGDGGQTVFMFSPELKQMREFSVQQPFGIRLMPNNDLLIGQRNQINLRLYGRDGKFIRLFWDNPNAFMDTFTIAPDGSVYVAWQSISLPRVNYLTHLDAKGNVLITKEIGRPQSTTDAVVALMVDRAGIMYMALTGFGRSQKDLMEVLLLDAQGDPLRKRPALFTNDTFYPPAALTTLNDASIIMFSYGTLGWWLPNGELNASLPTLYIREGFPLSTMVHRQAVATRPDGRSVITAEALSDGKLQLRIIELVDREKITPTPTPTLTPTSTLTETPTQPPAETPTPS